MVRWIMRPGNFANRDFRFRRVTGGNITHRIFHIDLTRPDDKATILAEKDLD